MTGMRSPGHIPTGPHKSFVRRNSDPLSIIITQNGDLPASPKDWNRWLVLLQIFTAPLFVVIIVWANVDEDHHAKSLLLLILTSLVFSLVCLLLILATTTPEHPPKYRPLFCFLGFIVAIAWISTIANEVVGVLKAFGVILSISDAILGLTIFAVGNSLGDLVADVTVAKLGYPVMALSACFGGPMLNILLGIGLSGLYVTIRHGAKNHAKHPHRPMEYKPFELEVSTTLMISGATLLVTLVGLLIFVPLNGWRMDRKVGWGLITLWSLSTIGNVVIEALGYGDDLALLWADR
jgi:sodium/potassium/calcium exchanger 6